MRIRTASERKDQGFTLIELLVVVVIIGILAAIAIPVFLNQREKAAEATIKSDLKNAATVMETYYVDEQSYVGVTSAAFELSEGVTVAVTGAITEFCLEGSSTGTDTIYKYDSDGGGLLEGEC